MVTQMDDIKLIKLVKENPILYDKNLGRKPGAAEMKDDIWHRVSQQMNCSERACITRWKSLRDRFGKVYRRAHENSEETVNWDMFEHLVFLRDHYKHGATFVNIKYEPKQLKRGRKRLEPSDKKARKQVKADEEVEPEELMEHKQLIALVKEHPVLYDRNKIRESKNLTLKNDAWRTISENAGISEDVCFKRWKKIRERFSREYRQHLLNPEQPVTWVYFKDLLFLEEHYRKGVPLPVDAIMRTRKKTKIPTENQDDSTLDEDCSFSFVKDEHYDDGIDLESIIEPEELEEFDTTALNEIMVSPNKYTADVKIDEPPVATTSQAHQQNNQHNNTADEPEKQLTTLITGIQQVLSQSQNCLTSLKKKNLEHKRELQSNAFAVINTQASMLQKVHILLDGLDETQRTLAERRIVQFLCECQIKTLNNDDVDDVSYTQIR